MAVRSWRPFHIGAHLFHLRAVRGRLVCQEMDFEAELAAHLLSGHVSPELLVLSALQDELDAGRSLRQVLAESEAAGILSAHRARSKSEASPLHAAYVAQSDPELAALAPASPPRSRSTWLAARRLPPRPPQPGRQPRHPRRRPGPARQQPRARGAGAAGLSPQPGAR